MSGEVGEAEGGEPPTPTAVSGYSKGNRTHQQNKSHLPLHSSGSMKTTVCVECPHCMAAPISRGMQEACRMDRGLG